MRVLCCVQPTRPAMTMYHNHTNMSEKPTDRASSLACHNQQTQQANHCATCPTKDSEERRKLYSTYGLDWAYLACRFAGCGQMTRSAGGGCMYLALPPSCTPPPQKGTVYIHRHAWGCCAVRGTHDAVPGTRNPATSTPSLPVEGSSQAGSVRRSHREA